MSIKQFLIAVQLIYIASAYHYDHHGGYKFDDNHLGSYGSYHAEGGDGGESAAQDGGHEGGYDHQYALSTGHDQGHDHGFDHGHDLGHAAGHDLGHDEGHDLGHVHGYDHGHVLGHTSGHDQGHDQGYDHGHNLGHAAGHDQGHDLGHDHHVDYYAHPKYEYKYGVEDGHTGDNKKAWEIRDGDVVKGGYEFYEPDGTKRVVEYTADKHSGFHATVTRHGHAHHPQVYGHKDHGSFGHSEGGDKHGSDHHFATSHSNFNLHHSYH